MFAGKFDNSEKAINTAVEAMYGEVETATVVANGAEGWYRSLAFHTTA